MFPQLMNVGLFYMLTTQHPATCLNSYPSSLLTWPSSSSMCGSNVQLTHLFVGGLLMLVITCFSLKIANVSMQHKPHEFHASKLIQPRHFGTVVAVLSLTANTIPLATWWVNYSISVAFFTKIHLLKIHPYGSPTEIGGFFCHSWPCEEHDSHTL